jgi:hypothetical protein
VLGDGIIRPTTDETASFRLRLLAAQNNGRQRRRTNESNFCDVLSAPLHSENLSVVRHVDPATGFVFTQYVDGSDQAVAGLSTTYSLQKADAGFIPPPT